MAGAHVIAAGPAAPLLQQHKSSKAFKIESLTHSSFPRTTTASAHLLFQGPAPLAFSWKSKSQKCTSSHIQPLISNVVGGQVVPISWQCATRRMIPLVLHSWGNVRLSSWKARPSSVRCQQAEEPTIDNSSVLVVGGGGLGLETFRALSKAGSWVTVYQRSDKFRKEIEELGAMLAIGDVLDPSAIEKTFKSNNFDAVVCTVGGGTAKPEVDKNGPINLIKAAKEAGVKRFILISSIGAGESVKAVDSKTYEVLKVVLKAKEEAEAALIDSGLAYTIVRPGGLMAKAEPTGKGVLTENSSVAGLIHRADVASLVLKVLFDKRTEFKIYHAIDAEKLFPPTTSLDAIELLSFA